MANGLTRANGHGWPLCCVIRPINIAAEYSLLTNISSLHLTASISKSWLRLTSSSESKFELYFFFNCSFKPEELTVRLGEYDFKQVNEARRDFATETIIMHESYDRITYNNDIALIKLKEKATFNDDIWPICLPPSNVILEGQSAYVTGCLYDVNF